MTKRPVTLVSLLTLALMILSPVSSALAEPAFQPNCSLSGVAYRDFNADGQQGAEEPGVQSVLVTAFNANGTAVDTATTDETGAYTLDQLPEGVEVRLEFSGLPSYLYYGPAGAQSSTSVSFVTCAPGATAVDIALANPGQHCDLEPEIATSCFAFGASAGNFDPVVVSMPYTSGSTDLTTPGGLGRFDSPAHTNLAAAVDIGSVYGLAYRRQTGTLYAGAYLKRHTDLGPDGPGAIYQMNTGPGGAPPSLFVNLPSANPGGVLHTEPWRIDSAAYNLVGKAGLGDMTVSDDDNTLWVVNLGDRRLYSIALDDPTDIDSFAIPLSPPSCPGTGNARPFAVEFQDGLVYVGVTCTGPSVNNLRAYVYSFNPAGGGFSLELNIPLNYSRRCVNNSADPDCETDHPAEWLPWIPETDPPTWPLDYFEVDSITYPQPWLTDIEFDNNGDMILGIRDRWGDMSGNDAFSPVAGDSTEYIGINAGDILRACLNNAGNWLLESDGACGGQQTAGSALAEGPGGGEYYFQDDLEGWHDELGLGSMLQVPGQTTLVATVFDPIPIGSTTEVLHDAGLRWFDNTSGETTRAYRVFDGVIGSPSVFGKANGLGGLEAFCPPAPIEIGNRVWFDLNNDGVQDPGEAPVPGVAVRLYTEDGTLIGEVITNAQGEFIFSSRDFDIDPNTNYVMRMDRASDFGPGGPLDGWFVTEADANQDQRDSDAVLNNGFPQITLTTGNLGDNDHTFDFGFSNVVPPAGINLVKSVDNPNAQVGDTVVYTYEITNTGPVTVIIDQLMDDQLGVITVSPTTLAPGDTATGTSAPVTIQPGQIPLTNIATVDARRQDTNEPLTDTDRVTIGGDPSDPGGGDGGDGSGDGGSPEGSPALRKSVNPPVAQLGDTVTWTIILSNPGDQPMTDVNVTDTIPNGLEIVSVSASAGSVSSSGQQVTFTIGTLEVGQTITISVVTRVVNVSTLIFENLAVLDDPNLTARARLLIASELVRTGETPWWREPVIMLLRLALEVSQTALR